MSGPIGKRVRNKAFLVVRSPSGAGGEWEPLINIYLLKKALKIWGGRGFGH